MQSTHKQVRVATRPVVSSLVAPLVVALSLMTAACGGGGGNSAATTVPPVTSAAPTTAPAPTTLAGATESTPAPAACAQVAPLTGLCAVDPAAATRPALVVKIDNHRDAIPQTGLNEADVVYEELVEGISRFAAVFQSQTAAAVGDAAPVGPIRSARTSDIDIVAALGKPLFAWSGGNSIVMGAVRSASVNDVGFSFKSREGGYYRDKGRKAPHNLYANSKSLFLLAKPDQAPPSPLFSYRAATDPLPTQARAVTGVNLKFSGLRARWDWNAATSTWVRSESDSGTPKAQVDAAGNQLFAANVVVLFTPYGTSKADPKSPEARTVGKGSAWVFTAGKLIEGCWTRPSRDQGAVVTLCGSTDPIKLTPGRTWIELPESDQTTPNNATVVEPGTDNPPAATTATTTK
jgi:Protein of unknown function (DUF3048) N-terminal domain/Protein of unknown function (DUF3048) C-terminal domain